MTYITVQQRVYIAIISNLATADPHLYSLNHRKYEILISVKVTVAEAHLHRIASVDLKYLLKYSPSGADKLILFIQRYLHT